jgi:hypothetical protein
MEIHSDIESNFSESPKLESYEKKSSTKLSPEKEKLSISNFESTNSQDSEMVLGDSISPTSPDKISDGNLGDNDSPESPYSQISQVKSEAPNEDFTNKDSPNEVEPNEVAPNEVAPNEVAPNEVAPNEVAPNEVALIEEVIKVPIEEVKDVEENILRGQDIPIALPKALQQNLKRKIKKLGKKTPKKIEETPKKIEETPKKMDKKSCDELINQLDGIIDKLSMEEEKYNNILKCISKNNRDNISSEYDFLYPLIDDADFNQKLSVKKEFYDTKYSTKTAEDFDNIEEIANKFCHEREFELAPHQKFVRNFLSSHTPYNSLLLFHGVGSGKTCSAISVCEEMRVYLKQMKNKKRILIVASPNVQENFKLQLFDQRKLKNIDGYWNIKSCTSNTFIKEINPMHTKGLSRDNVIKQIKKIIKNSYQFIGYIAFANLIENVMKNFIIDDLGIEEKRVKGLKFIRAEFSNRLIVIDEVQNIRNTDIGVPKETSKYLLKLVKYAENIKLLLLSATPMYDSPREIVWLLKLMNSNDERFLVNENEIFDSYDNLLVGDEVGKELLIRNSTGYISFVRGENPFTFPFRLFPNDFNSPHSIKKLQFDNQNNWYPSRQLNDTEIKEPIKILDIFISNLGPYQQKTYDFLLSKHKDDKKKRENTSISALSPLIQVLNISYPLIKDVKDWKKVDLKFLYGNTGLKNCFFYRQKDKLNFHYKRELLEKHGKIFSPSEIGKYSGKFKSISDNIKTSKGIIMIFSQYIDGGCVPLALMLEEMGMKRYNHDKSLFKEEYAKDIEPLNSLTMKPRDTGDFKQAHYAMITGDSLLSPDNKLELIASTNENNTNGEIIKVIIISRAGAEGLDFKNIRQIHILEPWFNINRTEQTIGRGVRNLSHCKMPFKERNVEIYLHGSELEDNTIEASDLYMYRLAEKKAKKIGIVSRILKQNAIDCKLNKTYNSIDYPKEIQLNTSSNKVIQYQIKDKPFTSLCDFMDNCDCNCIPNDEEIDENDVTLDTYNESFIVMNLEVIFNRIRQLFKEEYVYHTDELISRINALKSYPDEQIYSALSQLINDKNEFITDMLGRVGRLVNIKDFYLYQPLEIDNKNISLFERKVPLPYKQKKLGFILPVEISTEEKISDRNILQELLTKFKILTNPQNITNLDSKTKKLWINNCQWTITNLFKHNPEFFNMITLEYFALEHLLDLLNYKEKLNIITELFFTNKTNETKENDWIFFIKEYFNKFMLEYGNTKYIPIVNNELIGNKIVYVTINDKIEISQDIPRNIFLQMGKWKLRKGQDLADELGFITYNKRYNIQFKTKPKSSEKKSSGASCERGATKNTLISKINNLLPKKEGNKKYVLESENKRLSAITQIYNIKENKESEKLDRYLQPLLDEDGILIGIPINTTQLCIEIEMIYRYFESVKYLGKKWFFYEIESEINKIENFTI